MFKKIVRRIHLILGFASGLVIVLLGLTGCLLAFELEIRNATEPYRFVEARGTNVLPPTQLKALAEKALKSGTVASMEYPGRGRSAIAYYYGADRYEIVYLDPYTGTVLKRKDMNRDFFRIMLDGHSYLWLPHKTGLLITASATLIFLVMLITGLVLWWPKNRAARRQRFTIKWSARWRRRNYDLHNVLGFYATWVSIFLAITGLVMGFEWFARSFYRITNGGAAPLAAKPVVSDTTAAQRISRTDALWQQHKPLATPDESLTVYFPSGARSPVQLVVNHRPGTFYNMDAHYYDQYSGRELYASGSYAGPFAKARTADKILRVNYDVHVGAALGFAGKLLVFFASLIATSLPITGFLIWRGRRKKAVDKYGR